MSQISFFQTRAAHDMRDQIVRTTLFYRCIEQLVVDAGLEDQALTVYDLEDLIAAVPGASEAFAVEVSRLASNNGKDYVSAHEIRSRAKEHAQKMFKMTYLMFLLHRGYIHPDQFESLGLLRHLHGSGLITATE